jgi:branched-chain amino acid aminotransferase
MTGVSSPSGRGNALVNWIMLHRPNRYNISNLYIKMWLMAWWYSPRSDDSKIHFSFYGTRRLSQAAQPNLKNMFPFFHSIRFGTKQIGKVRLAAFSTSITSSQAQLASVKAANLQTTLMRNPKQPLPNSQLVFGQTFTDHMLSIEWTQKEGWSNPRIHPYEKISLDPSAIVFHYGLECFEGMKAYKDTMGKLRMFRPDMNMDRLLKSSKRLAFPDFDQAEVLECIKQLLKVDQKWIPSERGYSLYIRPTIIATQESLGVGASNRVLLFVICSPVGPYYRSGFAAVSLRATHEYTRAWPGGTGDSKLGANYAPGILPQIEAAKAGYAQNLWLFGPDHHITEAYGFKINIDLLVRGTMNFFVYLIDDQGEKELVTPPLDGSILPGVTRDSMLALARFVLD